MTNEGRVGIVAAIFRYFRFWNWKRARGIIDAADEQFTGSTQGIRYAFDIQQDKMIAQFNSLRDAVSEVEGVLEDKRSRLEDLNKEEEELIKRRDGAIALAEKSSDAGNKAEYERHETAFSRYNSRVEEIEGTQRRLESEIKETEESMRKHLLQLTTMQAEIQRMPQEKAEAIADFVSSTKIIELNDRLLGLQSSLDRGPIDAVRKANRLLTAKARITEKIAGTDVKLQDQEYGEEGRRSLAKDKLTEILAARKAEKSVKTGEPVKDADSTTADNRPKL